MRKYVLMETCKFEIQMDKHEKQEVNETLTKARRSDFTDDDGRPFQIPQVSRSISSFFTFKIVSSQIPRRGHGNGGRV